MDHEIRHDSAHADPTETGDIAKDVSIRGVRLADALAITQILNPIIESGLYTSLNEPYSEGDERQYIDGFPERGVFHVAELMPGGRLAAFQSLEPFASYCSAFDHVGVIGTFVDLAERRRGLGAYLAAATFEAAKEKGYEKILTYVRADNPAALGYYAALGFRTIGIAENQVKISDKYVDEVMIEKRF